MTAVTELATIQLVTATHPQYAPAAIFDKSRAHVVVENLGKRYGKHVVFERIHMAIEPGEVYALTGPNGAGKTTLIRCMTGLAFPDTGTVSIRGHNVYFRGTSARSRLGAVVEAPAAFYKHLTGRQNLEAHALMASQAPGSKRVSGDRIREVLSLLEIHRMADRKVGEYSLGQRQRLGVAAALLGDPDVLILDEPTTGLDPLGIGLIHRIFSDAAKQGKSVLLSTHHLREIAQYAHTVGILSGGRLVDQVNLRERRMAFKFKTEDLVKSAHIVQALPFVQKIQTRAGYLILHLECETQVAQVLSCLVETGLSVFEVSPDLFDLYDYYRERIEEPLLL